VCVCVCQLGGSFESTEYCVLCNLSPKINYYVTVTEVLHYYTKTLNITGHS